MRTLYFIRHAESVSNAWGVSLEHHAIPLTEAGQQFARTLAQTWSIRPVHLMVSELIRTHQTAQPLCDHYGMTYQVNPCLNELHILSHERIAGMTGAQRRPLAQAYWASNDVYLRLGQHADTFDEFRQRVDHFIQELPTLAHQTVIIGHGIWFGLLVWRLLGFTVHDSDSMKAFRAFQRHLPLSNGICYRLCSYYGQHWSIHHER